MKTATVVRAVLVSALILSANAGRAAGQQLAAATLRGVVTDPNGAVVAGANVKATGVATGATRETKTNGEGVYTLSNLPPGVYEISVEAQGFKKSVLTNATLQVGQNQTYDFKLEVGMISDRIDDLLGFAPLIDASASKVDQVIEPREIANLPLNGRNFLELALLTPGNAPAPNFDRTKTNTIVI